MSDDARLVEAIKGAEGKRLMYRPPRNGIKVSALAMSKEEKQLLDMITP
jgi:hypothetical protein